METTLNLAGVQTESKRIIKASYPHFLALSLFFLPLSVSLVMGPTFRLSPYHVTLDHLHTFDKKHIIYHFIYILIGYIFALCATATITYSTHHGFLGKPVKFLTSLKSLTSSFPILSTAIVALIISLSFLMFVGSILMLVQNFGFVIDYNSIHFMWFVGATFVVILICFHVNWSLTIAVVVVESKWGFEALMRSSYLMKGMRSVSLILLLYYGSFCGLSVWVFTDSLHEFSGWVFVFFMMLSSSFLMWFFLHSTAANTVMYNFCKELHGELAMESTNGFGPEYVTLPADGEKAPNVETAVTV